MKKWTPEPSDAAPAHRIYLRRALLGAASVLAMAATPAFAQQTGQAPVADPPAQADGTSGAATAQQPAGAVSDDAGQSQAAGAPGQPADPMSATPATPTTEIVVLGVRGAQRAAVDIKRNAAQIVDSVVAEDIGKLPDTTISDSLQRVPGVQIDRSAGEGSSVNIRGLGQVLVTLNGERFLGGSNIDGAQPNFTDIPPTLFSGVDVYKSSEAQQLEGGVSGTINLRTRRPFDLKSGFSVAGSAEGSYGTRIDKLNDTFSGLLGWRNDRFGLLVAGSYTRENLANTNINTGNSWLASSDAVSGRDLRGDGDISASTAFADKDYVYQPAVTSITNRTTERRRLGLNASGQYKVTDALTLTGDVAYTRLENHDRSVGIQYNSGYAALPLLEGSKVDENGVVTVANFHLPQLVIDSASTPSKSQSINTNLQLVYDNGGRFKATARWVHGYAKRNSETSQADSKPVTGPLVHRGDTPECRGDAPPASCLAYTNPNGLHYVDADINYSTQHPSLNLVSDVTNPANYNLASTWAFGDHRTSKLDAFRADGTYSFDGGFLKSIDIGGRYSNRSIAVENYRYLAPVTVQGLGLLDNPGDLYYYKDPTIGHTGRPEIQGLSVLPLYPFSALGSDVKNFTDFAVVGIPAAGIPAIDPRAMDHPKAFQDSLFPGNVTYVDPTDSFRVREHETTGYFQVNFGGYLGLEFSGNAGLRVVNTKRTIFSNVTNPNQFIGTGGSYNGVSVNLGTVATTKNFTRYLPAGNLEIDTFRNQKLRLAFAKVVGDLDLYDLGSGQILAYGANNGRYPDQPEDLQVFLQGSSGNPNLQPYQSTNYNASYEWYFGHGGLLSVAAFLFDVKSFPEQVNVIEPIADQDGVVRAGGVVTTYANGTGGKIKGLEVGYQQQFDFLPGFLSGFGINANYTLSDSGSSNRDLFGKTLPVPDNSKHQFNIIGLYQKGRLQGRVAYNWRSKRYVGLQTVNGVADGDVLAIYSKPVGYLDASASFDVTPRLTVYVQGTNLTGSYDDEYAQFRNEFYSQSLYDRRITFGLRFRL